MSSAVPFFLVTGFLGSGKTTLLKRFLDAHADTKRLAVIQNEFADGAIDGKDLRETGKPFEILEMNKGSVFCVCLLSGFTGALAALVDSYRPDAVILEASGLADPIAIAQILGGSGLSSRVYLGHVWCIIDAGTFTRLEKTVSRITHQVRIADTLVVNKTDRAPSVGNVTGRLKHLNPFARIVTTSFCDISLDAVFTEITGTPVAIARQQENAAFEPCGRPEIGSAAVRTTKPVSPARLEYILNTFGTASYRLKGYVMLDTGDAVAVQSCFGETRTRVIENYHGPTELIALGPDLETARFSRLFD